MGQICIKIQDESGWTKAVSRGCDEVSLVYSDVYREGDQIIIEIEEKPSFYQVRLDDAGESALLYLTGDLHYWIPFGEKRINRSLKVFTGEKHLLYARKARDYEATAYRNLAYNPWDQHRDSGCFPHASANVETRGESVFAAMNAIDGIKATSCHGEWPYQSWGINQREDAGFRLDFGRKAAVDRLILYTRADYPHDNWWKSAVVTFSDGSDMTLELQKSGEAQEFLFEEKQIEWLTLDHLVKGEEGGSPFPALSQIEVYGRPC
ncbi:MAG: carbohydrate-binding protein [Lachnospiraceae bacterium]|nr:carbohydrate-binding protein [Lachnospiraceae bacterium]